MKLGFQVHGAEQASAEVQAAIHRGVDRAVEVCGLRGQQLVQQNIGRPYLGRAPAVSTGNMLNAITFEVPREVSLSRAVVFASPPADQYVDAVEAGTMPHF